MDPANRTINKVFAITVFAALFAIAVMILPGETYAAPADKVVTLQNERPEIGTGRQIEVGQSRNFQIMYLASAAGSDARTATVAFTKSDGGNPGVLSITGVAAGLANIAYGNREGEISAFQYLITDSNNVSAYTIKEGGEMYFSVPAGPGQRETRPSPVTVTAGQFSRISWSSMNESVAAVASNGAVTSIGQGVTIIIGEFIDKWGVPRDIHILVGVGVQLGGDPGYTVESILISPPGNFTYVPQLKAGDSQKFTAYVYGTGNVPQDVTWEVSGNESDGTTIDSDGLLTAASDESADYVIIRATSKANDKVFKNQYIKIIRSAFLVTGITVTPAGPVQISRDYYQQFSATVEGGDNVSQKVVWEVLPNQFGATISSGGLLYIAKHVTLNHKDGEYITVRVTSVADPSVSEKIDVNIMKAYVNPPFDTDPAGSVYMTPGSTRQFKANVFNSTTDITQSVVWKVAGNQSAATKISDSGLLSIAADETADYVVVWAKYSTGDRYIKVYVSPAVWAGPLEKNVYINIGPFKSPGINVGSTYYAPGELTWTSSNTYYATVDQNGVVTGKNMSIESLYVNGVYKGVYEDYVTITAVTPDGISLEYVIFVNMIDYIDSAI